MITMEERLLKAEQDALNARAEAVKAQVQADFTAIMTDTFIEPEEQEVIPDE